MVSYVNVSSRSEVPLPQNWVTRANRLVGGGPLYSVVEVTALLEQGVLAARLFTDDCRIDVAFEGWALSDVVQLLKDAIQYGTYKNSQWCRQGDDGFTVPCAPCDAYVVSRHSAKRMKSYYVKFAISRSNTLMLVFSCHP